MSRLSRYLSLIPSWSGMKASLGAVSGLIVEVTHISVSPEAFVAVQPAGSAGAVTPSKFSMHAGCGDGVGVAGGGVGLGVTPGGVGLGVPPGGVGDGVPPGGVGDAAGVGVGTGVPPGLPRS